VVAVPTVAVEFVMFRGGSAVEIPRTGAKGFSIGFPPVSGTEFFFPSPVTDKNNIIINNILSRRSCNRGNNMTGKQVYPYLKYEPVLNSYCT
jgi:hypothetical protein